MNADPDWLAKKIGQADPLPTQPSSLPYLLGALGDNDIESSELAAIIERFPGIAARLISLANSAWSAPAVSISSLERACVQLGLGMVKNVSISLAVTAPFDPHRCPSFRTERFWCDAFLVADGVERLGRCAKAGLAPDTDTLRTGGLMHNLGLLWLADKLPEETERALGAVLAGERCLQQALVEHCGTDACQVGGLIGKAWGLPEALIVAMEQYAADDYRGDGWQVAALVGSAVRMVGAVINRGEPGVPDDGRLAELSIGEKEWRGVFDKLSAKLDDTMELTKNLRL